MAKTKTRSHSKCCFCGGSPTTKEHFWAQWSHPLLPEGDTHTRQRSHGWDEPTLEESWERQGPPAVITVKVVCDPCNSIWMSDYEEAVRPHLELMLTGVPMTLSAPTKKLLSEYFVMKTMVADQSPMSDPAFLKSELTAFYESRAIPAGLAVNIFRHEHEASPEVAQYYKEMLARLEPATPGGQEPGICNFTFRFSELFIEVLLFRIPELDIKPKTEIALSVYPPSSRQHHWPTEIRLDKKLAFEAQHLFQSKHEPYIKKVVNLIPRENGGSRRAR